MTIPLKVEAYLATVGGDVIRTDQKSAKRVLGSLGISPKSDLGEFYRKYQGSFTSPHPVAELLDIEGPAIPAIPDQTDYVRDRYNIPVEYLALTSDGSEGMYLYSKIDDAVYDLDIEVLDSFMEGRMPARWTTFNDFLVWYFDVA